MKLSSIAIATLLLGAGVAHADDDMDRAISSVCDYTKANDRSALRRKLEENHLELRHVYDDIRCGKASLLRVAAEAGALDTATLIVTKVGKHALSDAEGDGQTTLQWTQKRFDSADAATKARIKPVLDLMLSRN
jgi:hypothetical protein